MPTEDTNDAIDQLIEDLKSCEQKIVQPAISKISRIGPDDPALVQALVTALLALLNDPDSAARMRGCWALGQVGYKAPRNIILAIHPLAQRLSDPEAQVRTQAVWALGRIGRVDPDLVKDIIPAIMTVSSDPDPNVRQNFLMASENLAANHPDWLMPYLPVFIHLLDDIDIRSVRRQAPEVLRVIAKTRPDLLDGAVSKLEKLLNDPDQIVRLNAGNALSAIRKAASS